MAPSTGQRLARQGMRTRYAFSLLASIGSARSARSGRVSDRGALP